MIIMSTYACMHVCMHIQWSSSKIDTIREVKFVVYKKVSFIQGFLNSILIHFGTNTKCPLYRGCPYNNSGVFF